jgi:hypothetical protein
MLQSEVGYWSYITFLSYPSLIFVMDENDQQVTALDAEYMPAWSSSDNLLYCYKDNSGWTLKLWNLDSLIEIDTGYEIIGQWNNGKKVYCTSG